MSIQRRYLFKSDKFKIIKNEDIETNPDIYGKSLSLWIHDKLIESRYQVQKPIAEDWGWCIMCKEKPYLLWVGCSGEIDMKGLVWSYFIATERRLFSNPFKKLNLSKDIEELDHILKNIFQESNIKLEQV